jgi:hypothetical protein
MKYTHLHHFQRAANKNQKMKKYRVFLSQKNNMNITSKMFPGDFTQYAINSKYTQNSETTPIIIQY